MGNKIIPLGMNLLNPLQFVIIQFMLKCIENGEPLVQVEYED